MNAIKGAWITAIGTVGTSSDQRLQRPSISSLSSVTTWAAITAESEVRGDVPESIYWGREARTRIGGYFGFYNTEDRVFKHSQSG
jgi:hypothetical protein